MCLNAEMSTEQKKDIKFSPEKENLSIDFKQNSSKAPRQKVC